MKPSGRDEIKCPGCGAVNEIDEKRCFLCDREFGPVANDRRIVGDRTRREFDSRSNHVSKRTFSIASVMTFVAIFAACLAAFRFLPVLGILMAIFTIPPLLRTIVVAERYRLNDDRLSFIGKIEVFLTSFCAFLLIIVSSIIAFCVTCVSGVMGKGGFSFAEGKDSPAAVIVVISAVVALIIGFLTTRFFLKRLSQRE